MSIRKKYIYKWKIHWRNTDDLSIEKLNWDSLSFLCNILSKIIYSFRSLPVAGIILILFVFQGQVCNTLWLGSCHALSCFDTHRYWKLSKLINSFLSLHVFYLPTLQKNFWKNIYYPYSSNWHIVIKKNQNFGVSY